MPQDTTPPIAVAVGNDPAESAVAYAAAEALRQGCGLHVVHAVHLTATGPDLVLLDLAELEQIGRATLGAAVDQARVIVHGQVPVTSALVRGPVATVVLEATAGARLVVLQRSDLSLTTRTVTRSVSSGVAARAQVPVVSVPTGWSETNHLGQQVVTVGVDVPERSAAVLATAAAAARSRGDRLHVLHTWWFPSVYDDVVASRVENHAWAARAGEEIQQVLDGLGDAVAGLRIEIEGRHAHPADALLDAARESVLLVVGRHDALAPPGSHLGPVARAVLREATCPVLLANPSSHPGPSSGSLPEALATP